MTNNTNDPRDGDDKNVIYFPALDKNKTKSSDTDEQVQWRKAYRAEQKQPFLNVGNIPIFTKIMTAAILLISVPLLLARYLGMPDLLYNASFQLGFVPERLTGAGFDILALPTLFTHAFIHGDVMHLVFNAIMMLALGTLFERHHGAKMTGVFFFICVLAGAGMYLAIAPAATVPVIGASGGISGLFAATLMLLHDQNRGAIRSSMFARTGPWGMVAAWLVLMLVIGSLGGANIAWQSHLGGYVAGAALYALIRKGIFRV